MEVKRAVLCYVHNQNRWLMMQKGARENDPNSGKYTSPGGKIEPGETPEQTVVREIEEETGLVITNPELRGTVLFDNSERFFNGKKAEKHFFVHIFYTESFSGQLTTGEITEIPVWIPDSKIEEIAQHEGDKILLDAVKTGRKFSALIYQIGEKYCSEKSHISYLD